MWGKKTKRDIYDGVIKFKERRKNPYHWNCEDDLDGLLEYPKPHETDSIPANSPGADVDTEKVDGTATYQKVENDNTMAAGASVNSGIVHGTPHTYGMEGTDLPLLADDDNEKINEVGMLENEPA